MNEVTLQPFFNWCIDGCEGEEVERVGGKVRIKRWVLMFENGQGIARRTKQEAIDLAAERGLVIAKVIEE